MNATTTAEPSPAGTAAPTGEQHVITRGDAQATITELAATLRSFSIGGIDLVHSFDEASTPPLASGIVLVPWANRIEDGTWVLDGVRQQLDISEVDNRNAIHGLLRNVGYRLVRRSDHAVELGATVFPQHGYPFLLETSVRYELVDDGLAVTHTILNRSERRAPVAIGAHPYLCIGDVASDELELTLRAATHLTVDHRLIPVGDEPVAGTRFDLQARCRVADLNLDDGFTGLAPVDGVSAVLRAPDGREVRLHHDENFAYLQVFTPRTFPSANGPVTAVAIEPMTAPANAFNSGHGLKWLEPGERWSASWGIQYQR